MRGTKRRWKVENKDFQVQEIDEETLKQVHLRNINVYGIAKQKQEREKVMRVEVPKVKGVEQDGRFFWFLCWYRLKRDESERSEIIIRLLQ